MPRTRVPERLEKRAREIVEALDGTWSRSRGMCCCPAHDDRTPSLSVTIGVRAILFHCFAGCSNEAVLASLDRIGVKAAELFDGRGEPIAPRTRDEVANQNALRLWRAASAHRAAQDRAPRARARAWGRGDAADQARAGQPWLGHGAVGHAARRQARPCRGYRKRTFSPAALRDPVLGDTRQ